MSKRKTKNRFVIVGCNNIYISVHIFKHYDVYGIQYVHQKCKGVVIAYKINALITHGIQNFTFFFI